MGFSLGSNDAANIFGPGVASRAISLRAANILLFIFVIAGAILEGPKCMELMKDIGCLTQNPAFYATLAAAATMTIMSVAAIPASTSQAMMGGIVGAGLAIGQGLPDKGLFIKIVSCWVGTPIGAGIISFILMIVLERVQHHLFRSPQSLNLFIKTGLIISGAYGSYALGANNVANTTGVYYACGIIDAFWASVVGGFAIAIGAVVLGRRVMMTVGHKITNLSTLGALVSIMACSLTVHFYTQLQVPVSSSQAIVGAVIGIGLTKGSSSIYFPKLVGIFLGWLSTPLLAGVLAYLASRFLP